MKNINKILILDDHIGLRNSMAQALTNKNNAFFFLHAANKKDAINQLEANKDCDMILLDIALGAEDGLHILSELRAITPKIKTLVYTALDDQRKMQRAFTLNVQGYITKDSDIDEIEKAIIAVLENGS